MTGRSPIENPIPVNSTKLKRDLPPLSVGEKTAVAAIYSWTTNNPGASLRQFEGAYRRAKKLSEVTVHE